MPQMTAGVPNQSKCLTPKCVHLGSQYKGLCLVCFGKAKKLVAEGKTTWDELEALGLCKNEESDPFTVEFNKRKGEQGEKV